MTVFARDLSSGLTKSVPVAGPPHVLLLDGSYLLVETDDSESKDGVLQLHDLKTGAITEVAHVATPSAFGFDELGYLQPDMDVGEEINVGQVVWCAPQGRSREIFSYDVASGVTTKITDDTDMDFKSPVSGDLVAWLSGTEGSASVNVYDRRAGATRVTDEGLRSDLGYGSNGVTSLQRGPLTDER